MSLASVRSRRGFTLVEVVVVLAIGAFIGAALMALFGGGSGGSGGGAVRARTEYRSTIIAAPPAYLTGSGSAATIQIELRTDTLTGGIVTHSGAWGNAAGLTVVFSVAPNNTAWAGQSGKVTDTLTTGADGLASSTIFPNAAGSNRLEIKWTIPGGQSAQEGFPFEVR